MGMARQVRDLKNSKFGMLTVLSFVERQNGRSIWLCRCDCGNSHKANNSQLVTGKTKSCGCLHRASAKRNITRATASNTLPNGEAAKRKLIRSYKSGALNRRIEWSLPEEVCTALFLSDCHYCGISPLQVARSGSLSTFKYNGIDRINNSLGYREGNVVACCKICNRAKRELTYDEFVQWIGRLALKRLGVTNGQ